MMDYPDLIEEGAIILFLDFYKAFDSIEHEFIYTALDKFGFGIKFKNMVRTIYRGINSSVSLAEGTSKRFELSRGIRQGCPISPFLFLIAAELLNLYTVNCINVEGIRIGDDVILTSQLADDTCIFLKDENQVLSVLKGLDLFSKASGLLINTDKSEILAVHDSNKTVINGIKVKQSVKYLGITIKKSVKERLDNNFTPKLQKAKNIFNRWLQRDLTIQGRTLLSKTEGISRLVYPALSLFVDKRTATSIDSLLFKFIWKNKTEYIKRKTMIRDHAEGGFNAIDFTTLNQVFKINWVKQCMLGGNAPWFFIPN